jgi:hypothetical protein
MLRIELMTNESGERTLQDLAAFREGERRDVD